MTGLSAGFSTTYWRYATLLALVTVFYNLGEGLVSVYFGAQDETLTLFGFGVDSFVEVLSGAGVLLMILRVRRAPESSRSQPERTALRVTGFSFYLLAAGLALTALYNLYTGHRPSSTVVGIVVSLISIAAMWALVAAKRRVGHVLESAPILADANCTLVCIYMSLVLLTSSLVYQLFSIGFIDSLGAAGLIYFSLREGKEAFEKAAGMEDGCAGECE